MGKLTAKSITGLFWSSIERVGGQLVQFITGIILARLLSPYEFGIVGMLTIFMVISFLFIESGFGTALIQKQDITHVDSCSIFYFNIGFSLVITVAISLSAPWIAEFYREPILIPLTRVLSLNIVINAFGLIQTRLLTKAVDFKTQAKAGIAAVTISGILGITLALKGFGVWSLVFQSVGNNFLRTIFLWFLSSWRPSLMFSTRSLKEMFGYGSRILASGLLSTIGDNLYYAIIGRVFSAGELGLYTRAKMFGQLPSQSIASIVGRVTFPVFATIQHKPEKIKDGFKRALSMLAFLTFPLMTGIALTAKPMVILLLTEKWLPCVPFLQLICVVGLMYPLHAININLLKATGRSDLLFKLEIIKQGLVFLNIAIAWRWGVIAIIWGQIIISLISYYLNSYYAGALINYRFVEQLKDLMPYFAVTLLMAASVYCVALINFKGNLKLLFSQIICGVLVYSVASLVFKLSALKMYWLLLDSRSPSYQKK
jgi:teichuronic acid exporter